MPVGFVLINTQSGAERDVHRNLSDHPAVEEVIPLLGEYDLIAKLSTDNLDTLGQTILHIRQVQGVTATKSLGTKG